MALSVMLCLGASCGPAPAGPVVGDAGAAGAGTQAGSAVAPPAAAVDAWPPPGQASAHVTVDPACGAYCHITPDLIDVLGPGVTYPGARPYPSVPLGVATDAPADQPTWLPAALLWRDAAGTRRTLYAAPAGWMVLSAVSDGRWTALVSGPAVPDDQSAAMSASSPWQLVAVDASGTVRGLASSPGGGNTPPPVVALHADTALWATPSVPNVAGAMREDLHSGVHTAVDLHLPAGTMVDAVALTAEGDPLVVAGPANATGTGYVVRQGRAEALPLPATLGLADGTLLAISRGTIYAVGPGSSPRRLLAIASEDPSPLTAGSDGLWLLPDRPGGQAWHVRTTDWVSTPYRLPAGVVLRADEGGTAWYRVTEATGGGGRALSIWWSAGRAQRPAS